LERRSGSKKPYTMTKGGEHGGRQGVFFCGKKKVAFVHGKKETQPNNTGRKRKVKGNLLFCRRHRGRFQGVLGGTRRYGFFKGGGGGCFWEKDTAQRVRREKYWGGGVPLICIPQKEGKR